MARIQELQAAVDGGAGTASVNSLKVQGKKMNDALNKAGQFYGESDASQK